MSDHQDKKVEPSEPDTAVNPDQTHESQDQENESDDPSKKVIIVTSAMEGPPSKESIDLQDDTSGELLTKVHSKIGHLAQGDSYKNTLDLAFDRLVLGAEAPEYIAPEKPAEEPTTSNPAYEDFHFGESLGSLESNILEDPDTSPDHEFISSDHPTRPTSAPLTKILGEFSVSELGRIRDTEAKTEPNLPEEDIDLDGFSMDDFNRLTDTSPPHDLSTEEAIDTEDTVITIHKSTTTEVIKKEDTEAHHDFSTDPFAVNEDVEKDFWLEEEE